MKEGVGNLNRWSQSTASSKSSATHNQRGSFSRRLSGSFGSFGGFTNPQSTSPSAKVLTKPRPSPKVSPQDHPTRSSPTRLARNLPPIVTLSSLSYGADASDSPSTAATVTSATTELLSTSTSASGEPDYFGERWKAVPSHTQRHTVQESVVVSSVAARTSSPRHPAQSPGSESSRPSASVDPAVSLFSARGSSRVKHSERYQVSKRRHSRNRDEAGRGSAGTEGESSASSARSLARPHKRKAPSQKAMLSKALQKANHAVLLDNAQNFEGAMEAYGDACALLQQVMERSSTDEDRRKLEDVRTTYSNRIIELRSTDLLYLSADSKALPEPPRERDSQDQGALLPFAHEENEPAHMQTANAGPHGWIQPDTPDHRAPPTVPKSMIPPRRQSLLPPVFKVEDQILRASEMAQRQQMLYQARPSHDRADRTVKPPTTFDIPSLKHYIPPPLSPRRPSSPARLPDEPSSQSTQSTADEPSQPHHVRQDTAESTSWLDTIDESGGSSSSSVHSRTSSTGLRRKRIRAASGTTEAEFDAALDAAVEAAYPDGFEPDDDSSNQPIPNPSYQSVDRESVSDARRNVELAKEMVREAEREAAILLAKDREKRRMQEKLEKRDSIDLDYGDEEEDEEERMLEEMTRDYIMDESEYDIHSMSALPRQSDSSGFSGRTWGSSIGSNPATAATSLSTVAEISMLPPLAKQLQTKPMPPPAHPPPMGALPPPPNRSVASSPSPIPNGPISRMPSQDLKAQLGVRERRISGVNVKSLTIETNSRGPSTAEPSPLEIPQLPSAPPATSAPAVTESLRPAFAPAEPLKAPPNLVFSPPSATTPQAISRKELPHPSGLSTKEAAAGTASATSAPSKIPPPETENNASPIPSSPGRFTAKAVGLRKNFSSSSLRNKSMTALATDIFEISPNAPPAAAQRKAPPTVVPSLPTPIATNFVIDRLPVYLLETNIHSPTSPGSPNPLATNAPLPLEYCPESTLVRPFWFLRCIYHTIAHSRGAYLSTKLFVPRDIWRVKGVKLKNIDEKISQCDLLTAALLKLAKVDTVDADSVLVEMQFLESIMDQAQANLSKKLGNDVGVVGASALFKGSSPVDDAASNPETVASKSTNMNNKSVLSSWRKLRSKNSLGPSVTPSLTPTTSRDGSREGPTMDSLPMTTLSDPRFAKRDVSHVQCIGPNSNYMAALVRLCDAVQVLDQIARQVEDPGLRHSSQTHVGLELSMRHAAEFFGFYICRFVFNDVTMMLDKFVKRGTEWVLT